MTSDSRRGGATSGDVLLALAGVALVAALSYPRLERALMWRAAAAARADVEAVSAAAAAFRDEAGGWPPPTEPGVVPPGLAAHLPDGFSFQKDGYILEWGCWESVDPAAQAAPEPPSERETPADPGFRLPPPADGARAPEVPVETLATVTVHASDERLLAALLERFGAGRSFVRERSWTLVLPPGGDGAGRAPDH
jgi:hypothetical protein